MILLLILALSVVTAANGQTDTGSSRIAVTSDPPGAILYLDSVNIGTSPVRDLAIFPGHHTLRCMSAERDVWPAAVTAETLVVRPGDTVHCHCVLPRVYHVASDPGGAEIFLGDSIVAVTPAFLTDRYRGRPLFVRAAGHEEELLVLPESSGVVYVRLRPDPTGKELPPGPLITESQQQDMLPVYLSSGTAILSGVAAAYFKIKADSYYNDYRESGDPALLDRVHRYDTISGVSLVVSQVSIGALAYLLLLR
jgi:hypothetical protein